MFSHRAEGGAGVGGGGRGAHSSVAVAAQRRKPEGAVARTRVRTVASHVVEPLLAVPRHRHRGGEAHLDGPWARLMASQDQGQGEGRGRRREGLAWVAVARRGGRASRSRPRRRGG